MIAKHFANISIINVILETLYESNTKVLFRTSAIFHLCLVIEINTTEIRLICNFSAYFDYTGQNE